MFVDASAIVAMMDREPGWEALADKVRTADEIHVSVVVLYEAAHAIARLTSGGRKPSSERIQEARETVDDFLSGLGAAVYSMDGHIGSLAIEASMRYGKAVGHPADLNMGDCFAYACAKSLGVPLLYKGEDFAKTDLA